MNRIWPSFTCSRASFAAALGVPLPCAVAEPTVDEARDASGAVQSGPMATEAAPGHAAGEFRGGEEGQGTSCHLLAAGEVQWRSKAGLGLGGSEAGSPEYARPCNVLPGLSGFAEPGIVPGHLEVSPSLHGTVCVRQLRCLAGGQHVGHRHL